LWDLSLVDPDNRRPVDYGHRRDLLDAITRGAGADRRRLLAELRGTWQDGGEKLFLVWAALGLRKARPALFAEGAYTALAATGERADHVVAFARSADHSAAVTLVPRLVPELMGRSEQGDRLDWAETGLVLGAGHYRNVLADTTFTLRGEESVPVADLLADFPVALLTRDL
jgi:(1->4)-alpha-D-glucan 1-alpha-D-glucosylmutase